MKLTHRIVARISLILTILLLIWATLFYLGMVDEINDEVDDSLEDYSELIIIRSLSGEELPSKDNGSNNQYFLNSITSEEAAFMPKLAYSDSMVYIASKGETEPARLLKSVFQDDDGNYYCLTVSTPTFEKDDLTESIFIWIILLYTVLLVAIVIIVTGLFRSSMKPLYTLLNWLDGYKLGKSNEPLHNETTISEFRKLNEAAIRYSNRSEELFEQQKQFIGNASHEMQTPLAVCQNRIEILLEEENLTFSQQQELAKIHHTITHISRMNKSLLLLSKIDNGQYTDKINVEINDIIKKLMTEYSEVFSYKHIDATYHEEGTLFFHMSEILSKMLMSNLLKNCYVHTPDHGKLKIVIEKEYILFGNSGDMPLDSERIFERFYQGTKRENSTGLGLSIVNSICRLEGLTIEYSFENNFHNFKIFSISETIL